MEELGVASIAPVLASSEDAAPPQRQQDATLTSTEAETGQAHSLLNGHGHAIGEGADTPVGGDGLPTPCPVLASSGHTDAAGDKLSSPLSEDEVTADVGVGDEPSPVVGTLDDAQRFFDEGHSALRSEDYEQAAELLSRALEIRALCYGELALECAFTYYKYGCALLYKAQSESDALGGVKAAAETETGENGKDEAEEDVEDEEESDLDMAWKMLDIARVIYEKQQSHSIEEVDVISALADVSLEREDFEMCFRDYTRALEILEGLVEPDDRGIAELCFKLGLAQQLGYKPKEALRYCQQAVSVCEARLRRLRNEVAIAKGLVNPKGKSPICEDIPMDTGLAGTSPSPANSDISVVPSLKQEGEIKEIEQLLDDLKEKVVELQDMASGPSLLDSLKESNPGVVNSINQVFNVTTQIVSSQGGSSGSGLVAEPASGGFDAPSITSTTVSVTHLGIVGRGVKRATPVPVSNGLESTTTKKRSLDDMMTRGGAGDTQIGFSTSTGFGGSSS